MVSLQPDGRRRLAEALRLRGQGVGVALASARAAGAARLGPLLRRAVYPRARGGGAVAALSPAAWALVGLVAVCLVGLGWLTWRADRLVQRSIALQQDQIAAWEVARLQRQLLRFEIGVGIAAELKGVRDPAALRTELDRVLEASAVLREGAAGSGTLQQPEWQPPLRRILRLLAQFDRDLPGFVADPAGRGPAIRTGLRETGRLVEALALSAYTFNTRQAGRTATALVTVQRILTAVQLLLAGLISLLAVAVTLSLRERLRAAQTQIEAQRVVEGELRQARDRAEQASRVKSDFLASMSHELRTPLTAMLGFCQLVLRGTYGRVPKRIQQAMTKVNAEGDSLLQLVEDVLDLSRLEAQRTELQPAYWPPARCIEDAVRQLEPAAQAKGLGLEVELNGTHGPRRYDLPLVTRSLAHLIDNAIKFTERGSIRVGVEVRAHALQYHVADPGSGIAPERIATLFSEFQQHDALLARESPGAGLGLAIARRIVELHGGRIWVESKVGLGSTFRFCLPDNEAHDEASDSER
jgi:signal transduction histidine kinase